jgi:hypothetical protein
MGAPQEGHAERLTVPAFWWLAGGVFVSAVWWVFYLATPLLITLVASAVTAVLVGALLRGYGAVRVAADPDGFSAGHALLPYGYVGAVQALDQERTRQLLGVEADARAYLLVRSYCGGAVKVMVNDPADPTPYWLVSTRHPEALAASLSARAVRH